MNRSIVSLLVFTSFSLVMAGCSGGGGSGTPVVPASDTTSPTMTITATEGSSPLTSNDGTLSLTFTSSEATTDFALSDITGESGGNLPALNPTSSTVYTATFTPNQDDTYTITVEEGTFTDEAGNGNTQGTFTWTHDASAPIANFGGATDDVGSETGSLSNGDTTDDPALLLSGTNESGSTVKVFNGSASLGDATVTGLGWTFTAQVTDGITYQFNVTETDAAGNTSAATSNFDVTGDMTPPIADFDYPYDDYGSVTGSLTSGDSTDDANLLLSGMNESDSTVKVYNGAAFLGPATVTGNGWTFTAPVADGITYQFNVTETDPAGNTSVATTNFEVTGDMTAPIAAINDVVDNVGMIQGSLTSGDESDDELLGLVGQCESGATVEVYDGITPLGAATISPISSTLSAWDYSAQVSDGNTYQFNVTETDAVGNESSPSSNFEVTCDTVAPGNPTVQIEGGASSTGDPNVSLTLTATGSPTHVKIKNESTGTYTPPADPYVPLTSPYSWTLDSSSQGTRTVYVVFRDAAGNESGEAGDVIDLDSQGPIVVKAIFTDVDKDGTCNAGDKLLITFDEEATVSGSALPNTDFNLPVTQDSLGASPSIPPGTSLQYEITLDTGASIKTRGIYDSGNQASNDPSGIGVQDTDEIEDDLGNTSVYVGEEDIIPGFVWGQAIGAKSTYAVALGDFDNDGDLDLVCGNGTGPTVYDVIWKNNGTGSGDFFSTFEGLGAGKETHSIAVGDLNRDGYLDLVLGINGKNQVWLNGGMNGATWTGFGNSPAEEHDVNDSTYSVALGDVNNDGYPDLVCGNFNQSNKVWLNEGMNGFIWAGFDNSASVTLPGTNSTWSVALGDVDHDGDLDLVCGNYGQGSTVWINNGTFAVSFTLFQTLPSSYTLSVALGDINGDGHPDLVLGNGSPGASTGAPDTVFDNLGMNSGNPPTWLGFATSASQELTYLSGTSTNTYSVAFGDFDGDGDLDLLCGNYNGTANTVWTNETGTFFDSTLRLGSSDTHGITLGDVDGDGDLDLVGANYNVSANWVWLNSLSGTWGSSTFNPGESVGSGKHLCVALGDVDNDGDLDLVAGSIVSLPGGASVWLNDDTASDFFADNADTTLGSGTCLDIDLGDIDGDGDLDLVSANSSAGVLVWQNDGTGSGDFFGTVAVDTLTWTSNNAYAIGLGDFDGDGDLDLVCGNYGATTIAQVFENTGTGFNGTPETQTTPFPTGNAISIALGDVDNDGNLDFVLGQENVSDTVWINDGPGNLTFTQKAQSIGSSDTWSVVLGDIDGDGDLDLVCGSSGDGTTVRLNNDSNLGDFSNIDQTIGLSTAWTYGVALADVDGDGDLDLALARKKGSSPGDNDPNEIWLNGGMGSSTWNQFSNSNQTLSSPGISSPISNSAAFGDIDGDGDLDLIFGDGFTLSQPNKVWLNE